MRTNIDDLLRKFYNEIKSKTCVGEYEELLTAIENELDKNTVTTLYL